MTYNELTRRHFESASNAGVLTGPGTRRGSAGERSQGIWVQFDVEVAPADSGGAAILRAAKFLAYACPHVIAVADWLTQYGVGREAGTALPESVAALQRRFAVPTEKLGRLLLVEDAWIAAISSPYRQRAHNQM